MSGDIDHIQGVQDLVERLSAASGEPEVREVAQEMSGLALELASRVVALEAELALRDSVFNGIQPEDKVVIEVYSSKFSPADFETLCGVLRNLKVITSLGKFQESMEAFKDNGVDISDFDRQAFLNNLFKSLERYEPLTDGVVSVKTGAVMSTMHMYFVKKIISRWDDLRDHLLNLKTMLTAMAEVVDAVSEEVGFYVELNTKIERSPRPDSKKWFVHRTMAERFGNDPSCETGYRAIIIVAPPVVCGEDYLVPGSVA